MQPKLLESKKSQITLSVDLMGGDNYPDERLESIVDFIKSHEDVNLRIFVSKSYYNTISHRFSSSNPESKRLEFIQCERSVSMSESPFSALRQKRSSSLALAIKDVANKHSNICVTAGNTGAMVAFAKHMFNPIADIERPVLSVLLPSRSKRTLLLDVGATVDARADDMYQFARLGSAWKQVLHDVENPKVALLNVGKEANKGNDTVKQADALLKESPLNYIGYCEGSHLFNAYADVICCNGFVGNITLKSCEAMATFIKGEHEPAKKSLWQKFTKASSSIEPDKYNGALLLGLDGLVVKSHGNCNTIAFHSALLQAYMMAQKPIIEQMTKLLENS
jgi:glycerol-3-phosphate acyltransferase PlsX